MTFDEYVSFVKLFDFLVKCVKLKRFNTHALSPHQFNAILPFLCSVQTFTWKGLVLLMRTFCNLIFPLLKVHTPIIGPICVFIAINLDTFLCHRLAFIAINFSNTKPSNNFTMLNFFEGKFVQRARKTHFFLWVVQYAGNFSFLQLALIFKTLFLVWSYSEQGVVGHS